MMDETEKIKARYAKRKNQSIGLNENSVFIQNVINERELLYSKIINENFPSLEKVRFLEIGAGQGANINLFLSLGIKAENIFVSELLPERASVLRRNFPEITVLEGDAGQLSFENSFDIVFQSLVFTSILDDAFKHSMASKMWSMLKPGGIILWYDFRFNNPSNKDVKGVDKEEILRLFPLSKEKQFFPVTLAPPIGRRVGSFYKFINSVFPFLRSHIIAVIKK